MIHHKCGSRKGMPVAPIGFVDLITGRQSHADRMFDSVWECWEEDPRAHNMLCSLDGKFYIVHTCGEGYPVGDTMDLVNDQTDRWIGVGKWTILACEPHTPNGLKNLFLVAGKKKIKMATFK